METGTRPQTSIFRAADLIVRYESLFTPQRPATRLSLSPEKQKRREKQTDRADSRLAQTQAETKPMFHFDSQIRILDASERRQRKLRVLVESPKIGFIPGSRASTPSPTRVQRLRTHREDLFNRVVAACADASSSKPLALTQERTSGHVALRHWERVQSRLRKMKAYDPDLLVPLYLLQRQAEAFNEQEVLDAARTWKERATRDSARAPQRLRRRAKSPY